MKLAKYGLRGKMGTGFPDDLKPIPKPPIVKSYHNVDAKTGEEICIRYSVEAAGSAALTNIDRASALLIKPIFRQFPIGEN